MGPFPWTAPPPPLTTQQAAKMCHALGFPSTGNFADMVPQFSPTLAEHNRDRRNHYTTPVGWMEGLPNDDFARTFAGLISAGYMVETFQANHFVVTDKGYAALKAWFAVRTAPSAKAIKPQPDTAHPARTLPPQAPPGLYRMTPPPMSAEDAAFFPMRSFVMALHTMFPKLTLTLEDVTAQAGDIRYPSMFLTFDPVGESVHQSRLSIRYEYQPNPVTRGIQVIVSETRCSTLNHWLGFDERKPHQHNRLAKVNGQHDAGAKTLAAALNFAAQHAALYVVDEVLMDCIAVSQVVQLFV